MQPSEPPDPTPTPARASLSEAVEGTPPPSLVPPEGMAARLLELGEQLRTEGVAVGTSELLDAFAVLREIPWTSQGEFREALAATLAKSQEDRHTYELVFDRFFFRAVEIESVRQGVEETGQSAFDLSDLSENELDALRRQIAE